MARKGRAYVALGSNIEPRLWYIRAALFSMCSLFGGLRASAIFETEPEIVRDQARFLNAVAFGTTELGPHRLLDVLQAIERRFGRRREKEREKGPRTLDLDLLLYDGLVERSTRLSVPHPGIAERNFVLVPLVDVDPGVTDPVTGRVFRDVLAQRRGSGVYRAPIKLYTSEIP